jgi:ABC-2 type transport system ATP-binding protein
VGYLPGDVHLYETMTGREQLDYIGSLYGGAEDAAVTALAERLDCDLSQRIAAMSHGTRQKIALIAALVRRPDLLFLDEPTQGLDPLMQQEFYRLVEETRGRGGTVFLSSHVLPEVERVCDRVAIIREGRLVTVEHIAGLKARAVRRIEIHFAGPVPHAAFVGVGGVTDVHVDDSRVTCTVSGDLDAVIKAAAKFHVVNVVSHEPTLEEIFLAYYGKGASDAA